jgi:thiol-disulfide isomerase/thioredoxin
MDLQLITEDGCAFCDDAKELLDRLSAQYGFSVSVLELDTPQGQTLAERGGIMFPPGILIEGEPFSYGRPSERRLRRELDRRIGAVRRP